jgi:hypothetical protein
MGPGGDMAGQIHDLSMNQNCNPPMQLCNGFCTDTSSDNSNCGTCNHACTGGTTCVNNQCISGGQPDLSMSSGTANCGQDINCANACMDQTCIMQCQAMSKPTSWQLLVSLINCVFMTACPDTAGGICDPAAANQTPCMNCVMMAQAQGGACYAQTQACANDP